MEQFSKQESEEKEFNREFKLTFPNLISMKDHFNTDDLTLHDMSYEREGDENEGEIGIPYYCLERNPKTEKIVKQMLSKRISNS